VKGDEMRAVLYRVRKDLNDATDPWQTRPSDSRLALAIEGLSNVLTAIVDQLHPPAPVAPPPVEEEEEPNVFDGEPVTDFDCTSSLMMAGRGRLYCGFYPFDDPVCVGKLIRIGVEVLRVRGIERFALLRPVQKGDAIAFLVSKP
jgi:hypothetical protein